MSKKKTQFVCQECGFSSFKWLGRCPGCEAWNSFVEEWIEKESAQSAHSSRTIGNSELQALSLSELEQRPQSLQAERVSTTINEVDRVLGGGLVSGSFILLGGDPGIGKSTIILQVADGLSQTKGRVLYVSGEESREQIQMRAKRLSIRNSNNIFLAAETLIERVFSLVEKMDPQVLIVDSLQTFSSEDLQSAPGSVAQAREVTARLMNLAKSKNIAVWLIGHVTKEGMIAGPKMVEHMVDTVLYFEGEGTSSYRLLRAVKNRFGKARELGIFEMRSEGLIEVPNPSHLFLTERENAVVGTAISVSLQGTRPILLELQALVASTSLSVPRRTSLGLDGTRVSLLAAILEKHLRVSIAQKDLFFNVAGGLRISETAVDLAALCAIWSSVEDLPLPLGWVYLGEVGLTGEIRQVSQLEERLIESKKLGFKTAVIPKSALQHFQKIEGLNIRTLDHVSEIKSSFFKL